MGLHSAGWLAGKLPRRVDKATVKHDFICSPYTLLSATVRIADAGGCRRNLKLVPVGRQEGRDRKSKIIYPFKLFTSCTV